MFNGTVLVAKAGKVLYENGFGEADKAWNIPNEVDTKFKLASVSKQFTAMLVLQLVAEGKLALNTPISNYLPELTVSNEQKITIHHLMTHSTGIPNYTSLHEYRDIMST